MDVQWFLVLIWLQFGKVISDCPPPVYRGVQGFGPQCRYRCNCKEQTSCNKTGECPSGCLLGWMGPSCQYRNLVTLLTQQTPLSKYDNPDLAIDENVDTCSRIGYDAGRPEQRYWHASLQKQSYIVGFVLKIKQTEIGRFRGFSIYVGNSSTSMTECYRHDERSDGQVTMEVNCKQPVVGNNVRISLAQNKNADLCEVEIYGEQQFNGFTLKVGLDRHSLQQIFQDTYVHNEMYQPRSATLTWPVTGSVVSVEREKKEILVVCELEIFADCPLGRCGWECNETCMCSSQTTGTHKIQGTCPYGCSGRWTGPNNTLCPNDKWGPYCNNECIGHCDKAEPCEASTGFCPGSCQPGWKSQQCNEECDYGTFGKNCNSTCGRCKDRAYCNKTSGHCGNGCEPGYQQPMCIAKCDTGTYGDDCVNKCGNCGNGDYCDHVTGDCPRGCSDGYKGTKCISECDSNKYGNGCSENCGNCKNGEICNHISGKCENGCQPGLKTPLCKEPCDGGVYGDGCKDPCGHCLNNAHCTPVNGSCPGGCAGGYSGSVCKSECRPGFYGPNCEEKCGKCDNITNCDKVTGKCNCGCLPGWLGSFCIDSCKDGFYGVNCQTPCGNCSNGEPCDKTSGYCRACAPGYQMKNCIETCVNRTYGENCALSCGHCDGNDPCDITNGICHLGCAEGFSGMFCHGEFI